MAVNREIAAEALFEDEADRGKQSRHCVKETVEASLKLENLSIAESVVQSLCSNSLVEQVACNSSPHLPGIAAAEGLHYH